MRGTLSFSTGIDISDNPELDTDPDGTSIQSRTSLGFLLQSETRTETFSFSLGTDLVGEVGSYDGSDDDFRFINDAVGLSYTREGFDSRLAFSADYSRFDLDDTTLFLDIDGDFDLEAFEIDGGSRERTTFGLTLETGIEGPLGFRLDLSESRQNYIDTIDPDLNDSDTTSVDALARFRLSPALTARALAGYTRTDEEDAADTTRERRYVGVGLEGESRGGFTFSTDVLFDDSDETVSGTTTSEDGVGIDLSMRQERPAGSVGFSFSSRIDETGRRTSAAIDRQFELPDGAFGLSVGVLENEDDSARLTTQLNYRKDTPRGGISATLSQTPATSNGDSFLNTRFSFNYQAEINNTSSWNAGLSYAESNELGGDDDNSRTTAQISYTRELTSEWGMTAGFEHTRFDDADSGDGTSNTVFFNIGRDITFGF